MPASVTGKNDWSKILFTAAAPSPLITPALKVTRAYWFENEEIYDLQVRSVCTE